MGDVVEKTIGGDWGKEEGLADLVQVACLRGVDLGRLREEGWSDVPRRWIKPSSLRKRVLGEEDVLVAASGVGPLGRPLWMSPALSTFFDEPVMYSNFCKRFRALSVADAVYVDRILHEMRESDEIWQYASGTSIPNLNQDALLGIHKIILPPRQLLEEFYLFYRPINDKKFSRESLELIALRDTLLPKLVSGELRLNQLEGAD